MVVLWVLGVAVGVLVAVLASARTMRHVEAVTRGSSLPPFLVGVTLVAIGTDLPEIANSVVASAAGHGDLNVGDSIGSAATQITLVLGLLPFFVGGIAVRRRPVLLTGLATCACIGLGAVLVSDGALSRGDALLLLGAWVASTLLLWRGQPPAEPDDAAPAPSRGLHALAALGFLAIVGAGAALAVHCVVEIAVWLSAPQYLVSFFGLSLGTSLPELVVDVTALRRGQRDVAIGDVFGSSLVDASLSIAAGPLLFPNVVDGALATRGALVALAATGLATLLVGARGRHDRRRGLALIGAYAAAYVALIAR